MASLLTATSSPREETSHSPSSIIGIGSGGGCVELRRRKDRAMADTPCLVSLKLECMAHSWLALMHTCKNTHAYTWEMVLACSCTHTHTCSHAHTHRHARIDSWFWAQGQGKSTFMGKRKEPRKRGNHCFCLIVALIPFFFYVLWWPCCPPVRPHEMLKDKR